MHHLVASQNSYTLGVGSKASDRLNLQNAILRRDFENHLLEAGLQQDMVVLDLGCGNGVMTFWIASQIGPNGKVIAVDRSPEQLEIAQTQAAAQGLMNIEFVCCDVRDLELSPGSIDLVCCRFLLMHLPDPLQMIKKALHYLKDGGVFAAQEPINSATYLHPADGGFIEIFKSHVLQISTRYGVDYDLGNKVHSLFYQAGYQPIKLHFSQRTMSIRGMKDLMLRFYEDIGPAALKSGAMTEEELTLQRISIQNQEEKEDYYYVIPQQAHISAYKKG